MEPKQVILCKQCFYFSSKIQQSQNESILFLRHRIEWRCEACGYHNIYQNMGEVGIPSSNLLLLRRSNIVGNLLGKSQSNYLFLIDCRELKKKVLYYSFHERKIIQEATGRKMPNLKTIEQMQTESQWLEAFQNKCESIQKFAHFQHKMESRAIRCLQQVVYLVQKCIKLIVTRSSSKDESDTFYIKVIDNSEVYHFQFTSSTIKKVEKVSSLLLALAIIDCEEILSHKKWLRDVYKQDIANCSKYWTASIKARQMIVFSRQGMWKETISEPIMSQVLTEKDFLQLVEEQRIVNIGMGPNQKEKDMFSMHPLSEKYLLKLNCSNASQISNILPNPKSNSQLFIFYSNRQHQILRYVGSFKESHQILQLLFNFQTNSHAEKQFFKNQVVNMLKKRNIKAKNILKICLQIQIKNENRVILYTFDCVQYKQEPQFQQLDEQIINQWLFSAERFDNVQSPTDEDFSPFFARSHQSQDIVHQILKLNDEDYICL